MTAENNSGSLVLVSHAPASTRLPGTTATRIQNLPDGSPAGRLDLWRKRLAAARSPLTALDAYSGDAWSQIKAGHAACPAASTSLWVASAGLGLVPSGHTIPNYAASFADGHPDCPGKDTGSLQRWWEALCQANAREHGLPQGIAGLVRANPAATFLIVLSADSLAALHADLWEAREAATDPDRFLILAGGPPACLGLGPSLLRVDTRFERLLGGPRHTVAPRMFRHLLAEFALDELRASVLQPWLKEMSWRLPKPEPRAKPVARRKISTLELDNFLRAELSANPHLKPATLSRKLKDAGKTCDGKLFQQFYNRHALPLLRAS